MSNSDGNDGRFPRFIVADSNLTCSLMHLQ